MQSIKDFMSNLWKYFSQYLNMTGIHGIHYLSEHRSITEKLLWGILQVLSLVCCVYYIYMLYAEYEAKPVIITYTSNARSIRAIPFPAITICPETKIRREVFNYAETFGKLCDNITLSPTEWELYQYMFVICEHNRIRNLEHSKEYFDDDFFEKMIDASPPFEDIITECQFLDPTRKYPCREALSTTVTDEGFCYTFNLVDRTHIFNEGVYFAKNLYKSVYDYNMWDHERGYRKNASKQTYPFFSVMYGALDSVVITLKEYKKDVDPLCKKNCPGYRVPYIIIPSDDRKKTEPIFYRLILSPRVRFHSPLDIPQIDMGHVPVSMGRVYSIIITPQQIDASDVMDLSVDVRNCYLHNERNLTFFKQYTYRNCMAECKASWTLKRCNCVAFYMPRTNATKICGSNKYKCAIDAEEETELFELQSKLANQPTFCRCLSLCASVSYEYFVSFSDLTEQPAKTTSGQDGTSSILRVYYESPTYHPQERKKIFKFPDLVSKLGGIVSVLAGMSVITVIEFLYFLSLRIMCNMYLFSHWWRSE